MNHLNKNNDVLMIIIKENVNDNDKGLILLHLTN